MLKVLQVLVLTAVMQRTTRAFSWALRKQGFKSLHCRVQSGPYLPSLTSTRPASSLASSLASSEFTNHLKDVATLRNEYFALRHGQSLANVAGIIASDPSVACSKYGLSDLGKEQAALAGNQLVRQYQNKANKTSSTLSRQGVAIVTSDLLRAKETAQSVADAVLAAGLPLFNDDVVIDARLRERGFGKWDGGSDEHYGDVWKVDAVDPSHTIQGVESVLSVTDRATKCVIEWDMKLDNHWIVCVAHGDVLQILQTAFSKMDPSQHRSLDHLETATLRPLILGGS
mmetsp:Transcript_11034/g.17705  ORF Transcript_11034/g.17705 Transcript_11034/m.17705 type:complete len:285 (+) Transcript_11034:166-1020(+)|eukprot:CAMPEP_0178742318 /NCGR_PEP_ID=MMETSP0744-20121128/5613_1 /TAXON_ID=913974 /ORGANISM="Nitzschia punctata, Strain CCMP561" /LENGTH=284 /DNA_ID=CAMNT_0020395257 /DNA_START=115 /DNA_END=969 /DNA_ORIENTATION=-